jgi:hypothetical protein
MRSPFASSRGTASTMTEKKKRGTRTSKKVAAPDRNSQQTPDVSPASEAGPADVSGNTSHYEEVYQEGRDALDQIGKSQVYEQWLKVAAALGAGRAEALAAANTNRPEGRTYNKAFGSILKREGLSTDKLDSAIRNQLLKIDEHRAEIESWREQLTPARRATINHPSIVLRNWRKTPSGRKASPSRRETRDASLLNQNVELNQRVEQLNARVEEVEQERDQAKREHDPQFIEPSAIISALMKVGKLKLDDLMGVRLDFEASDLVKLAEQIKQLAEQWQRKVAA